MRSACSRRSSTTSTCGWSASRRPKLRHSFRAGRRSCTELGRRCSPTKTGRSPTRTRSRPGSTIRASAPSMPSSATAAARSTYRPTTPRRLPPSASWRAAKGSFPRSSRRTRSRAHVGSRRSSCSSAVPVAGTRTSRRCSRSEVGSHHRADVDVPGSGDGDRRRAPAPSADRRRRRRRGAGVPGSAGRGRSRVAARRRRRLTGVVATPAADPQAARPARALPHRGHQGRANPRRGEPSQLRSTPRCRGGRLLVVRRRAWTRHRHPLRSRPPRRRFRRRHRAGRGACPHRQRRIGARAPAPRFPTRGREAAPASPRRRARRRDALRSRCGRCCVKTLVIYLMSGRTTPQLAAAAVDGGADIVELGFPFSDPLADGPMIRRAAERALAEGMRTRACLDCLRRTSELVPDTPLVPMTYAALLEAYGWERFDADARAAGASSLIVADLPDGDRPDLRRIQLVAPTSTDARLALAADHTDGWLYLVTLTGTTGAREGVSPALGRLVERARALTTLPLYAGFGISTSGDARGAAALADGIVVGSRAVEVAEQGPDALRDYVRSLR